MKSHRCFPFQTSFVCIAIFCCVGAPNYAFAETSAPLTVISRDDPKTLLQRGSAAAAKGDYDDALTLFQKALTAAQSASEKEMAITLIAQTLAARAEKIPENAPKRAAAFANAVAQLRAFDSQFPKSSLIPANDFALAKALFANGDLVGAEKTFREVANRHLKNVFSELAYFQLVAIYERKGDNDAIERVMQDFLARYPQSDRIYLARFNLVNVEVARKDYDLALSSLAKLLGDAQAPVDLRARAMLLGGGICEAKNERNRAIDFYMKTALLFAGTPKVASEALWRAAQLLEQQAASLTANSQPTRGAQLAKAIDAYRTLAENYPKSPHAAEARARLQMLTTSK